jgi:hypothetical protein
MDTLTSSRNWLPALSGLKPGRITVMLAPHAAHALLLEGAARLALHGTVRVLDGGNQFNAYNVARSIRRYTSDLDGTLARIHLARAFTCYQVETLITGAATQVHPTSVTLVLDMLSTFNDENVSLAERRRLLDRIRLGMRAIARQSVLVVGLRPPHPGYPDTAELVEKVLSWADDVWQAEARPVPQPALRLFA